MDTAKQVAGTDSAKRVARTIYQLLVALVTIAPILATALNESPAGVVVAVFAGWAATIAAVINALEEVGLLPPWLKAPTAELDPQADSAEQDHDTAAQYEPVTVEYGEIDPDAPA